MGPPSHFGFHKGLNSGTRRMLENAAFGAENAH
jgi:hypothetical protein